MELNVSNIQHFSVGDGPGIRTTVFLKGCNLRCPWCHNPETISAQPQELFFEKSGKRVLYGSKMSIAEVVAEGMEDADFYSAGGGGVTVSGGEPLLQSEAVAELLAEFKKKGISTLVDTACNVPWEAFERVIPVTDIFYCDCKTGDDEKYSSVIGANGALVYENICKLIAMGCSIHVRVPLIPEFNTSAEDCKAMCKKLVSAGVKFVDLIPFHRMGSAKYEALGKEYVYKDTHPQGKEEINAIAKIYEEFFTVTVE